MPDAAPIVLFAYARPEHTLRTLQALSNNTMASETRIFIYIDGPKGISDKENVDEVRDIACNAKGFQSVWVCARDTNVGLAHNIIEGVTEICGRFGKVIVVEDDIVTSPYFLSFMNRALNYYQDDPRVWHVTGWNYPIDPSGLGDAFFWRVMNCWGWGTWTDRWQYFRKDSADLVNRWEKSKIRRFNLDGAHNFWKQVLDNHNGESCTWAIFWYASIFERNGLCLNPSKTLVKNIGRDGSGENCGIGDYDDAISDQSVFALPDCVTENMLAVDRIGGYYRKRKRSIIKKLRRRMKVLSGRYAQLLGV